MFDIGIASPSVVDSLHVDFLFCSNVMRVSSYVNINNLIGIPLYVWSRPRLPLTPFHHLSVGIHITTRPDWSENVIKMKFNFIYISK